MSPINSKRNHKIIFITGSSSGIGEQTAYLFAAHGDSLILTYHRDKEAGDRVAKKCLSLGAPEALLVNLDLTDDDNIIKTVKTVITKYGHLDILINNAGYLGKGILNNQNYSIISLVIKTNLEGPIKLTKECLPYIKKSIINIGSNLGLQPKGGLSVYSATKAGIRLFGQSLARELKNINIYTVNPSLTATQMGDPSGLPPEKVAHIIFNTAFGNYYLKSGSDVNIRDYLYGSQLKYCWIFIRWLKHQLWKLKP